MQNQTKMTIYINQWDEQIEGYKRYITLEKNLSANTIESYLRDVEQFRTFVCQTCELPPNQIEASHIEQFMSCVYDRGSKKSSQARALSGVSSFFNYLVSIDLIDSAPTEFVDSPKSARLLPDVLSIEEIDSIESAIDLSHLQGHRNKAIIETLYSCGLRVSELTSLRISDLFFDDGFIRVIGKGNKQRLVPISDSARSYIEIYLEQRRNMSIEHRSEEILFLNRHGRKLTRVMIFTILKQTAQSAGITKSVSPHTLRHSFATHLLAGGASIRQVQELLGHESISTTEIYTHLDTKQLRKAVEVHHPLGNAHIEKG